MLSPPAASISYADRMIPSIESGIVKSGMGEAQRRGEIEDALGDCRPDARAALSGESEQLHA